MLCAALILLASACGGGGGGGQQPVNTRFTLNGSVTDLSGSPLAGVQVLLSLNPTVTDVAGNFSYGNLPAGNYIVSLQDQAGNYDSRSITLGEGSTSFSFSLPSTDGLRVVSTSPSLNSSGADLGSAIELTFNQAPDPSSVSAADFSISPPVGDLQLELNGDKLLITPRLQLPLAQNMLLEFTGSITAGAVQMEQPLRLRFTTSSADDSDPRLAGTRPAGGVTNHPPNIPVIFDYNEALDTTAPGPVVIVVPDRPFNARVSGNSVIVSAEGGWEVLTDYRVTVAGVRDLAGNTSTDVHELRFRTAEQAVNSRNIEPDWNLDTDTIVFSSNLNGSYDIFSIRPDGTELTQLTALPGDERHPTLNSDGSLLALQRRDDDGFWQVMLVSLDDQQSELLQLTSEGYNNTDPYFSRTFSDEIAFVSTRQSVTGIWSVNAGNLLETELDESFGNGQYSPVFHPLLDGQLLFMSGRSGNQDIWRKTVSVISGETININLTEQLLSDEHSPAWGPDAAFFVFISDFDGYHNLWVGDATGALHTQLTFLEANLDDPVIDPVLANNRCLVTMDNGSGGSDLVLFDLTTGEMLQNLTGV